MIRVVNRKRAELREPVDLDDYDGDIHVVAHWYKLCREVNGDEIHSVYGFETADLRCYNIKHIITTLELPHRIVSTDGAPRQFEYDLRTSDKQAIDRAIADIAGDANVASERTVSRRASQQMADDGRTRTVTTSARSGRVRSQVR
jgi:hypothetical protein